MRSSRYKETNIVRHGDLPLLYYCGNVTRPCRENRDGQQQPTIFFPRLTIKISGAREGCAALFRPRVIFKTTSVQPDDIATRLPRLVQYGAGEIVGSQPYASIAADWLFVEMPCEVLPTDHFSFALQKKQALGSRDCSFSLETRGCGTDKTGKAVRLIQEMMSNGRPVSALSPVRGCWCRRWCVVRKQLPERDFFGDIRPTSPRTIFRLLANPFSSKPREVERSKGSNSSGSPGRSCSVGWRRQPPVERR